jgi:hypothetical protein
MRKDITYKDMGNGKWRASVRVRVRVMGCLLLIHYDVS